MSSPTEKPQEAGHRAQDPAEQTKDQTEDGQKIEDKEGEEEDQSDDELPQDFELDLLRQLHICAEGGEEKPLPVLDSFDLAGIAKFIQDGKAKRIICMCGAGISVSAGLPDFRTPGTGLYSQLEAYNLPTPESIFTLSYFRQNPEPFHKLAKELFPGEFAPTPTHYFMTLLHKKGLLLRCFTQNIDSLEHIAGLPKDMIVPAHGNFDSAACIDCGKQYSTEWVRRQIFAGNICRCEECSGLVKPEITFFGENLPMRFFQQRALDFPRADLLIIMGTSLTVSPFCNLVGDPKPEVPRLLVNRELVSPWRFDFSQETGYRDVFFKGDTDSASTQLAQLLGWGGELAEMIRVGQARWKKHKEEEESERLGEGLGRGPEV